MLMTGSTMRSIFNQTAEGGTEGRAPFGWSMAWKESSTNLSSEVGELEAVNKVLMAESDRGSGERHAKGLPQMGGYVPMSGMEGQCRGMSMRA